jgi:hypothetical protein
MQENRDLISTLRMDLAELTALHAPSGAEQPVIARLRDLFAPLVDSVQVDHMGNLTATREGPPEAPHLLILVGRGWMKFFSHEALSFQKMTRLLSHACNEASGVCVPPHAPIVD